MLTAAARARHVDEVLRQASECAVQYLHVYQGPCPWCREVSKIHADHCPFGRLATAIQNVTDLSEVSQ
jgi:DNA-binding helix-hairpin-helix protein with protein kinase domain